MHTIPIPKTSLRPSAICLGVADWGTKTPAAQAEKLYDWFRAAGGNFFDTAHIYAAWVENGAGLSERSLAPVIRREARRSDIVIGTKGGHPTIGPKYPRPDRFLAPEVITRDLTESLGWLGTDYVDLYYLHRDDARVPVGEIIDALDEHVKAGRIRYPAASNWSTARIAEANAYAATHGRTKFVASQVQWSLPAPKWKIGADPTTRYVTAEDETWHQAHGLPVIPYSTTAGGYIASGGTRGKEYETPENRARLERAAELATQLGCTPGQIAIAYLTNHPFPVIPITGTGNQEHLADTIGALQINLTPEQVRWLKG